MNENIKQALLNASQEYGTPCWVYDTKPILERIKQLKVFDVVRYAQKANPNLSILALMRSEGVCIDAVSLGEIERAIKAGFCVGGDPAGIVYTSDVLDETTLRRIVELNIPVNAGSPQMLEQLGRVNPGHKVWLRINPGFGHGHSKKTNTGGENSKHGNWFENLDECYRLIDQYKLELIGLHMHIGSGVDYGHLERLADVMVQQVTNCPYDISAISAGGGLPVKYRPEDSEIDVAQYYSVWDRARKKIEQYLGHKVLLEIEPGRVLVAESGYLVSEVRAFKNVGRNRFVLVNAGFNDLMRPAMYGSYHQISTINKDGVINAGVQYPTVIAGPLCEAGDVFTQTSNGDVVQVDIGDVQVGDLIIFHNCGAYGSSMSSNYNSRPLIPEVILSGDTIHLSRRRQTIQELLALEEIVI
jgi:diaminopimelate decarboxylase